MKLVVDNLSLTMNGINILKGISFEITGNSLTCIIGPNGSGKTSILKSISKQITEYSGSITDFHNSEISYLPQNLAAPPFLNVYDVVSLGFYGSSLSDKEKLESTMNLLKICGVSSIKDRSFNDISAGEKQRSWLAFALAQSKDVVMMDEPFAEIDLLSREKFFDLLRAISSEKTLIIVTHEIDLAVKYAEHIICIKEGRKIFDGPPSNFDKSCLRL